MQIVFTFAYEVFQNKKLKKLVNKKKMLTIKKNVNIESKIICKCKLFLVYPLGYLTISPNSECKYQQAIIISQFVSIRSIMQLRDFVRVQELRKT